MQKLFIFCALVIKTTIDWVLNMPGRVLVRLGGGDKINRLCKNKQKVSFFFIPKLIQAEKLNCC